MQRRLLALCLLAALSSFAAAQRVAVFDFQPVDVDPGTMRVAMLLLRERLGDVGGFVVVAPPAEVTAWTVDEAVAAGRALNVSRALVGSITRLGSRYIVAYKLVDVAAAATEFGDRAAVGSADELDLATERIARSIRERRSFAATGEVGKVTAAEQGRTSALSSFFLTTGYASPLWRITRNGFPRDPGTMLFTLDAAISYETPDILAQGLLGYRTGQYGYNEVYFDLLVHRLFGRLDVSPYLGAGIGIHRMEMERLGPWDLPSANGLALIASGGIVLFRTQYFRIVGGLKGSVVLSDEFGTNLFGSFNFGMTSPTLGPGGSANVPSPCVYGAMGGFFIVGLLLALLT